LQEPIFGPIANLLVEPKLDPDTHKPKPLDEDPDGDAMDVDHTEVEITPMPSVQGIQALRDKLHAKMDQVRRNKTGNQFETKDELLEERRRQRGLMRDRRRKETKEKIRLEKETKEKKNGKGDKKSNQHKVSAPPKVCEFFHPPEMALSTTPRRTNSLFQNPLLLSRTSPFLLSLVLHQAKGRKTSRQHQIHH
jgi:hypothetical protein